MDKFDLFRSQTEDDDSNFKFKFEECRDVDVLVEELQKYIMSENLIQEVLEAYRFAEEKHREQKRKNGDPFIIHPLSAAYYLAQWRMAPKTIIAGLLHDVVEDTPVTYYEVESLFGEEVANMVEAVTKATYFTVENRQQMKAVYLRKLFMSMIKDIRVIIIKIADRMHNLLTLKYMKPEKQKIIAQETLDVYASVAERIGMRLAKNILEDYSFKYLDPEQYEYVSNLIEESRELRENRLHEIIEKITETLKFDHFMLDVNVFGRPKSIYSIYNKMAFHGKNFNDINDLLAIRIICNSVDECYSALGYVHNMFIPLTGNFKDYIAVPKNNLYQSLHTVLSSRDGAIFEVQIRTHEMDEIAERGIAAHWKYKEGIEKDTDKIQESLESKIDIFSQLTNLEKINSNQDIDDYSTGSSIDKLLSEDKEVNINTLLGESVENEKSSLNVAENLASQLSSEDIKNELNNPSLYIMTPDSSIIIVPFRSTVIDFAYKLGRETGNKSIGAKVNGTFAPLNSPLNSGDLVEILTSEDAKPSEKWLKYAKTPLAKNAIHSYLNEMEVQNKTLKEKTIAKKILAVKKEINKFIEQNNLKWDVCSQEEIEVNIKNLNFNSIDEFLASVYEEAFTIQEAVDLVYVNKTGTKGMKKGELSDLKSRRFISVKGRKDLIISNSIGANYEFAKCCFPLPTEDVVGVIDEEILLIHCLDCEKVKSFKSDKKIEVKWNPKPEQRKYNYLSKINISGDATIGILHKILGVFSSLNIQVLNVNSITNDEDFSFASELLISPTDLMQLQRASSSIEKINGVYEVIRIKNDF